MSYSVHQTRISNLLLRIEARLMSVSRASQSFNSQAVGNLKQVAVKGLCERCGLVRDNRDIRRNLFTAAA